MSRYPQYPPPPQGYHPQQNVYQYPPPQSYPAHPPAHTHPTYPPAQAPPQRGYPHVGNSYPPVGMHPPRPMPHVPQLPPNPHLVAHGTQPKPSLPAQTSTHNDESTPKKVEVVSRNPWEKPIVKVHGESKARDDDIDPKQVVTVSHNETFNLNSVLHQNIVMSKYYYKVLSRMETVAEVLNEARSEVKHVQPYIIGHNTPSTAFACLVRLMDLKLQVKQLNNLLAGRCKSADNDSEKELLMRALGFLYVRFMVPSRSLWGYFEPYLEGGEDVWFEPGGDGRSVSFRQYLENLLTEREYYGILLPRVAVPAARKIEKNLLTRERMCAAGRVNVKNRQSIKAGAKVQCLYEQDGKFYPAVIVAVGSNQDSTATDSIEWSDKTPLSVQFDGYEGVEDVTMGHLRLPDVLYPKICEGPVDVILRERARSRAATASRSGWSKRPVGSGKAMSTSLQPRRGYRDNNDRRRHSREDRSGRDYDHKHRRNDRSSRHRYSGGSSRSNRESYRRDRSPPRHGHREGDRHRRSRSRERR